MPFIGPQLTFALAHILVELAGTLDGLELAGTIDHLELAGALEEVAPEFGG